MYIKNKKTTIKIKYKFNHVKALFILRQIYNKI